MIQINLDKHAYFRALFIIIFIIITMTRQGLGLLKFLPIDLEDALVLSIFVLVFPY